MTYIQSYKDLIVWKKAVQLVKEIYILTALFPPSEIYVIIAQMKRAAISIPSNIAEGYGRKSTKEYMQFYSIAYGSALELETQMLIAKELRFAKAEDYVKVELLLEEVLKMLNSMIGKMKQNEKLAARR